jgi:hypothetical protein
MREQTMIMLTTDHTVHQTTAHFIGHCPDNRLESVYWVNLGQASGQYKYDLEWGRWVKLIRVKKFTEKFVIVVILCDSSSVVVTVRVTHGPYIMMEVHNEWTIAVNAFFFSSGTCCSPESAFELLILAPTAAPTGGNTSLGPDALAVDHCLESYSVQVLAFST